MDSELFTEIELAQARTWVDIHYFCHAKHIKGCWSTIPGVAKIHNIEESRLKQAINTLLVMKALDS